MPLPLIFILVTVAIDAMGVGLILPVTPDLIREINGGNLSEAALWGGILATSYAVMQFICGPAMGALSDRFGRRPVLLLTLALLSLDYLVMAVAGTLWLLFIGRIVAGVAAATQATALAFIADISKPEEKAVRFGMVSAAFGLGFVVGPLIGGLLAEFGTRAPFYAAAAISAANLVFGWFVLPETVTDRIRRHFEVARANPFGAFAALRHYPAISRLMLMFFLYQVAFMVYPSVWAYFTQARFGWSPTMTGISLASFGLSLALVQGVLIRGILARFGDRMTVIYGLGFNAVAFLAIGLVTNGTVALFLTPITSLGAVVMPALQGFLSRAAPDDAQGELQGLMSSATALALILSPLISTSVFAAFTRDEAPIFLPGAPFLVSMLLMGACYFVFMAPERRQSA
ncbi:MAG: TCR/Tet family MFS transporter [Pseudomonadota bacterium]